MSDIVRVNEFDADRAVAKELADRELSRRDFLRFIERMNPGYQAGWAHKDLARRLQKFSDDVIAKKSPRLMVFWPPRHGKSTQASIGLPAFHLGREPTHEVIAASYSSSLAMNFSRQVRGFVREPLYHGVFPQTELSPESQNAENWLTTLGGGYFAAGVGGGATGRGAHVFIIDDPVKNREDAESQTQREVNKNWYTSTAYTRLAPGGGVLLIMTRWHDDDLAGWLEEQMRDGGEQWEIVSYPAIATEDELFRAKGDALHPERYDIDALERIRRAVGPRDFQALYQQSPVAEDGAFFRKDMIRYYGPGELPNWKRLKFYQAWDLAIGQNEMNDFSVGITVAIDEHDNAWIVGLQRGRWDSLELTDLIIDEHLNFNSEVTGIEHGQIKLTLGPFLNNRIAERKAYSLYVDELRTGKRDKISRARSIQAIMQQGRLRFPKDAPWVHDLVNEMLRFPNGKHDDQVDALAWIGLMINDLIPPSRQRIERTSSFRDKLSRHITSGRHSAGSAMSA